MNTETTEPTSSSRMHARLVNTAAEVIARAMENGRQTPAGWAVALDSARLLQSPETAAELAALRARLTDVHRIPQDNLTPAEVRLGQYRRPPQTFETGSESDLYDIASGLQAALEETRQQRNAARLRAAELEEQQERRRAHLVALQNDALDMRGSLSPNGQKRKVPFALGKTLTPAVDWLIARVAELEALLAEYERPADEDPITYTLTDKTPDDTDDVTPQVTKLRDLLAGQREQTGDAS